MNETVGARSERLRRIFEQRLSEAGVTYTRSCDDDIIMVCGDDNDTVLPQAPEGIRFPGDMPFEVRVRHIALRRADQHGLLKTLRAYIDDVEHGEHHVFPFLCVQHEGRQCIVGEKPEAYTLGIVDNIPMFVPRLSTSWEAVDVAMSGRCAAMIQGRGSEAACIPIGQFATRLSRLFDRRSK